MRLFYLITIPFLIVIISIVIHKQLRLYKFIKKLIIETLSLIKRRMPTGFLLYLMDISLLRILISLSGTVYRLYFFNLNRQEYTTNMQNKYILVKITIKL